METVAKKNSGRSKIRCYCRWIRTTTYFLIAPVLLFAVNGLQWNLLKFRFIPIEKRYFRLWFSSPRNKAKSFSINSSPFRMHSWRQRAIFLLQDAYSIILKLLVKKTRGPKNNILNLLLLAFSSVINFDTDSYWLQITKMVSIIQGVDIRGDKYIYECNVLHSFINSECRRFFSNVNPQWLFDFISCGYIVQNNDDWFVD